MLMSWKEPLVEPDVLCSTAVFEDLVNSFHATTPYHQPRHFDEVIQFLQQRKAVRLSAKRHVGTISSKVGDCQRRQSRR